MDTVSSYESTSMSRRKYIRPPQLHYASLRNDGDRCPAAAGDGQLADRLERGLDPARGRLVRDDVERRAVAGRLLHEPGDGDALDRELPRERREHAGSIRDSELQVPRRREVAGRHPVEVAPDRVVLEEAGPGGADDRDHVRDD